MKNNKLPIYHYLLLIVLFTNSVHASQSFPKNDDYPGLSRKTEDSSSIYVNLLIKKLGNLDKYEGLTCKLNISLTKAKKVKHVEMNTQNSLCRKAFNTIWDIESFALPDAKIEQEYIETINITLLP